MTYKSVIGLEVHIELKTEKKVFCECKVAYGQKPNTHCCPICMGMPNQKPKFNQNVIFYAVKAGVALNCNVNSVSSFDRKHYHYHDLPKGYQITQYFTPICQNGYLQLESGKQIHIQRIHIEEDTGKSVYVNDIPVIDFNRSGVPLIEIVTAPEIQNEIEAGEFVEKLQTIMKYAGVSDCKMNQGNLRCDVNISLKNKTVNGERVEIKNLNSVSNLKKAIKSELQRQTQILDNGEKVLKQTLKYDEKLGKCVPMREKEDSSDYGYIPEPDLPPIILPTNAVEQALKEIGELPETKIERFIKEYSLKFSIAQQICKYKLVADFFEKTVKLNANSTVVANLIVGTIFSKMTEDEKEDFNLKFSPEDLAKLATYVDKGYLFNNAQKVLLEMMQGKCLDDMVSEKDLKQLSKEEVMELCRQSIQFNFKAVEQYLGGNCKAINALVGYVIKKSQGKVQAGQVQKILEGIIRE